MAEQTAEDRYIECGRPCKPGHTLQWDQCQQASDPLGELGPAIRAARDVINGWETFTAPDGNLSIREKAYRGSGDIAREVVEVVGPLLAAIDGPEPDWADLREMARNAGWTRTSRLRDYGVIQFATWTFRAPDGRGKVTVSHHTLNGWDVAVVNGPDDATLQDPAPAKVLAAAHLVGLGGDR